MAVDRISSAFRDRVLLIFGQGGVSLICLSVVGLAIGCDVVPSGDLEAAWHDVFRD